MIEAPGLKLQRRPPLRRRPMPRLLPRLEELVIRMHQRECQQELLVETTRSLLIMIETSSHDLMRTQMKVETITNLKRRELRISQLLNRLPMLLLIRNLLRKRLLLIPKLTRRILTRLQTLLLLQRRTERLPLVLMRRRLPKTTRQLMIRQRLLLPKLSRRPLLLRLLPLTKERMLRRTQVTNRKLKRKLLLLRELQRHPRRQPKRVKKNQHLLK